MKKSKDLILILIQETKRTSMELDCSVYFFKYDSLLKSTKFYCTTFRHETIIEVCSPREIVSRSFLLSQET